MIIKKSVPFKVLPLAIAVSLAGCGDDNLNPDALNAPETYEFESKIQPGLSTVNYREATTRLMLIRELNHLIKSDYLQAYGENNTHEDVVNLLNRYYTIGTKANDQSLTSNNVYDEYDPEGIELSGPTPLKSIELGENQSGNHDYTLFGGLPNNAGSGKTGDVNFTTVGHTSADTYTIILYMRKTYG